MTGNLFTNDGERKYLNADELENFITEAIRQPRAEVRTFCLVLVHTGCRISEALELTARSIDIPEGAIKFRTLKQRDHVRYRSVPVPDSTLVLWNWFTASGRRRHRVSGYYRYGDGAGPRPIIISNR